MDEPIGTNGNVDDFVFATYFLALRDAWSGRISNDRLITILYDVISSPLGLMNRDGNPIVCSPSDASRLKNRQANAHNTICSNCKEAGLKDEIISDFELLIIPKLEESKVDILVATLMQSISCSRCSKDTIEHFSKLADARPPTEFLARALQESLSWDNKLPDSSTPLSQNEAKLGFPRFKGKIDPDVPTAIEDKEMPYVHALVKVYGEEEGTELKSINEVDQFPRSKEHLSRQRKDYYSAEFVRRCMRDAYDLEGDDQFDILEKEIYDGVIDTHTRKYDTGRERLDEVLSQASCLSVDGCFANRDTDWIRISVKKGVCHFLVNDRKIKGWLDEDR